MTFRRTWAGAMVLAAAVAAGWGGDEPGRAEPVLAIPEVLAEEHGELHDRLVRLTESAGRTGEEARAVAKALHAHFGSENELALPLLGLLPALAEGVAPADPKPALELAAKLRKELPAMLEEHRAIVGALERLRAAGEAEGVAEAVAFARGLAAHARTEEAVLYPAALVAGKQAALLSRE